MPDLWCTDCGETASYADADIADRMRTCGDNLSVARYTAGGMVMTGTTHNWREVG